MHVIKKEVNTAKSLVKMQQQIWNVLITDTLFLYNICKHFINIFVCDSARFWSACSDYLLNDPFYILILYSNIV